MGADAPTTDPHGHNAAGAGTWAVQAHGVKAPAGPVLPSTSAPWARSTWTADVEHVLLTGPTTAVVVVEGQQVPVDLDQPVGRLTRGTWQTSGPSPVVIGISLDHRPVLLGRWRAGARTTRPRLPVGTELAVDVNALDGELSDVRPRLRRGVPLVLDGVPVFDAVCTWPAPVVLLEDGRPTDTLPVQVHGSTTGYVVALRWCPWTVYGRRGSSWLVTVA